jgi:hypothetical protein
MHVSELSLACLGVNPEDVESDGWAPLLAAQPRSPQAVRRGLTYGHDL